MSYLRKFIGLSLLLAGFCFVSLFFLSSPPTSADEPSSTAHATATITVPEACTFSGTVNTPHRAEVPAGTYVADIGSTTFKVVCNDSGGFSVYAIGYTGEREKNDNNNVLDATIGGTLTPAYNIASGTATSGNTSNWAMKLTPVAGTYAPTITNSYDDYNTVPLTSTKVAQFTSVTDAGNNATGSSFTATYRAYVSGGQPAGTYDGKVKYIMVHPATNVPNEPKDCSANKICYFPNAGNTVVDNMGDQQNDYGANSSGNIVSNANVNLWVSNFKRPGYGFVGWSDAYDYVANEGSVSNPSAHIYGPQENITLGDVSTRGLSLYAVWAPSEGILQSWDGCSILPQGNVVALTDIRNNETYTVAKLVDGKCWMIENLRLNTAGSLDEANSQGWGGVFSGLPDPEETNYQYSTANSRYIADGTGSVFDLNAGSLSDVGSVTGAYIMPRYNEYFSRFADIPNWGFSRYASYDSGNLYTWSSAIANTSFGWTKDVSFRNTSICPSGWRLPSGGGKNSMEDNDNDFYALSYALVGRSPSNYATSTEPYYTGDEGVELSKKMSSYPNNILKTGGYWWSDTVSRLTGYYWTSRIERRSSTNSQAYNFSISNNQVYPGSSKESQYRAQFVRCLKES